MHKISEIMKSHYTETYLQHGDTSKGVDWGINSAQAENRQHQMLSVANLSINRNQFFSILDVGCGYGALADLIDEKGLKVKYTGVDIVPEMVTNAKKRHPDKSFLEEDFLATNSSRHDYVVCNGILTQKLTVTKLEMDHYAKVIIRKMFELCNIGIAFNIMNTNVNFQNNNLYYQSPIEMASWCISELSPRIKMDCAYDPWFEYTVYVFKSDQLK